MLSHSWIPVQKLLPREFYFTQKSTLLWAKHILWLGDVGYKDLGFLHTIWNDAPEFPVELLSNSISPSVHICFLLFSLEYPTKIYTYTKLSYGTYYAKICNSKNVSFIICFLTQKILYTYTFDLLIKSVIRALCEIWCM